MDSNPQQRVARWPKVLLFISIISILAIFLLQENSIFLLRNSRMRGNALLDQISELEAALEKLREKSTGQEQEIQQLQDLLAKLRESSPALREQFFLQPEARALPPEKRDLLADFLIPVLGKLPDYPWQYEVLAEAEAEFRPTFRALQKRMSEHSTTFLQEGGEIRKLKGDPEYQKILREMGDLWAIYRARLEGILDPRDLKKFFPE